MLRSAYIEISYTALWPQPRETFVKANYVM